MPAASASTSFGQTVPQPLWGDETERARQNFQLSDERVRPELIAAYADVKHACASANLERNYLDQPRGKAILAACDQIAAGDYREAFPLDAVQGGAGTSTNMNLNEVIAALANRSLSHQGENAVIDPLEHVNLHQSTNDTFPTALKVAAIRRLRTLSAALAKLQGTLQRLENRTADIPKMGRTQRQPAVPLTLGAEFSGFSEAIARDRWRTAKGEERLRVVNLGGSAVGTALTVPRGYLFLVVDKLRERTGLGLARAENLIDATAQADAFVEVTGMLEACADNLVKLARDLRELQARGEIRLPRMQAGSSLMPGKINPVILEATLLAALKARSENRLVSDCAMLGSAQINEYLPLLANALLSSLALLERTALMLAPHLESLEANRETCQSNLDESPALITAFLPHLGYHRAEKLLQTFQASDRRDFRAFLSEELGVELVERTLSPHALTALGHPD